MSENEDPLRGIARRFAEFHEEFAGFFATKTHDRSEIAGQYLKGLVQASSRNMERMEEKVVGSNLQSLQHFITNSPWDERALMDKVAKEGDRLLGGSEDSCLIIDETSFVKKGRKSVGVARQYCGRLGKTENCQVAVVGALVRGDKSLPVGHKLYLPEEWVDDLPRCLEAGVPESEVWFDTKPRLATEIVRAAIKNGVRFSWVGGDAGYGQDSGFVKDLFDLNLSFVLDVKSNHALYFPSATGKMGSMEKPQKIHDWLQTQPPESWETHNYRDSHKGPLTYEYLHTDRFWIKITNGNTFRPIRLLVRRSPTDHSDIKYSISNAPFPKVTIQRLAYMQGQRFWIERAFQDSKSSLGMAEYQLRKWRGWHHHMALICLANLFMLLERFHNQGAHPLLSMEDIVTMLVHYLPKRDASEEEVYRQLAERHKKRQQDIDRSRC